MQTEYTSTVNATASYALFGELYGSAVETRIARDFIEVPVWLSGGPEPSTVSETLFRADRLKTMRMRLSAAYKGVNALLMNEGAARFSLWSKIRPNCLFLARTWTSIQTIFPQDWCKTNRIKPDVFSFDHQQDAAFLSNKSYHRRGSAGP